MPQITAGNFCYEFSGWGRAAGHGGGDARNGSRGSILHHHLHAQGRLLSTAHQEMKEECVSTSITSFRQSTRSGRKGSGQGRTRAGSNESLSFRPAFAPSSARRRAMLKINRKLTYRAEPRSCDPRPSNDFDELLEESTQVAFEQQGGHRSQ